MLGIIRINSFAYVWILGGEKVWRVIFCGAYILRLALLAAFFAGFRFSPERRCRGWVVKVNKLFYQNRKIMLDMGFGLGY